MRIFYCFWYWQNVLPNHFWLLRLVQKCFRYSESFSYWCVFFVGKPFFRDAFLVMHSVCSSRHNSFIKLYMEVSDVNRKFQKKNDETKITLKIANLQSNSYVAWPPYTAWLYQGGIQVKATSKSAIPPVISSVCYDWATIAPSLCSIT